MKYRCPTCRREANKEANKWFPFCCERCQLADLGAWLAEDYRIADQPDTSAAVEVEPAKDERDER